MERLTSRTNNNAVHMETPSLKEVVFKLCEYEDTGLEPAEITELKKEVESKETYSIELYNRCKDAESRLKHYEDIGFTPEQLASLVQSATPL